MPIYEYVCADCSAVFELIRPMAQADEAAACVVCGGKHTKRKVSLFFAESGGRAVSGMAQPACSSCVGRSCAQCGR